MDIYRERKREIGRERKRERTREWDGKEGRKRGK